MIKSAWQNFITSGICKKDPNYDLTQIIYVNTFSLVGISAFLIFGWVHLFFDKIYLGILEVSIGIAGIINVLVLRKTHNHHSAGSIILSVMMLALIGLLLDGGLGNTGSYWYYTFPLLAFFLKGKKGGIFWVLGLYLFTVLSVLFFHFILDKTTVSSYIQMQQLFMSLLAVSTLVYFYERIRSSNERIIKESQKKIIEQKLMEEEIKLAENLQRSLLPSNNLILPDIDLVGYYQPSLGVSGDYYDYFPINENQIAAVLCDVSGKGVPAALVMVNIRAVFKTLIKRADENLLTTAYELNNLMIDEVGNNMFTTLFAFIYSRKEKEISFFNAGHGPLTFYSTQKKQMTEIDMLQLPLGIIEDFPLIEEVSVKMNSGDIIVIFSDGITEASNEKNEEFGKKRLFQIIEENKELPAKDICRSVIREIKYFSRNSVQKDDISLILAKIK